VKRILLTALGLLFASASQLGLALEWKTQTLTYQTTPFQKTQEVSFEFKNAGEATVTLLDVQTNCDCLETVVGEKTYAPGAKGNINAIFRIGERAGITERVISVITDESPEPVRLTVRIEVPEIASILPRSVQWRVDEEHTEKIIELKPASGLEIQFTSAQSTNADFTAQLESVEPGSHYRVVLKPTSTAQPTSAAIRIFGREKSGRDIIVSAYVSVN
jgi:hypothetical protein